MPEQVRPGMLRVTADVLSVQTLTPHMRRITVGGTEVSAFLQMEGVDVPGAWVKVFIPTGEGRAYTVRNIDYAAGTLDIDFVLHGDEEGVPSGPVSGWAGHAMAGERISMAGPRNGGFALPSDVDWVILAGDATALPAMQAIARVLPAGIRVKMYAEVHSEADQQPVESRAALEVRWLYTQATHGSVLSEALLQSALPEGAGYIWIAGESGAVRRLRTHYLQVCGIAPHRLSAKGYWKAGEADHRDRKKV